VTWRTVRRGLAVRVRALCGDDRGGDAGNAIIEFVFVAVVVLVPLVYVVVAVASVQRSTLAVTQAAREAGRAFATADSTDEGLARSAVAVRLALADQGLADDADLRFVGVGVGCESPSIAPTLAPGAEFAVCVVRHAFLPGVPTLLSGRGITTVGRYVLHVDDYRTVSP
jgi:Flp pilus assembly protein TadG